MQAEFWLKVKKVAPQTCVPTAVLYSLAVETGRCSVYCLCASTERRAADRVHGVSASTALALTNRATGCSHRHEVGVNVVAVVPFGDPLLRLLASAMKILEAYHCITRIFLSLSPYLITCAGHARFL